MYFHLIFSITTLLNANIQLNPKNLRHSINQTGLLNTVIEDMHAEGGYILGDLVWKDDDQDGYQDLDEQGIPDITVELFGGGLCTGTVIAETRTNIAGLYNFTSLAPGDYCLKFSNIPINWEISIPNRAIGEQTDDQTNDQGVNRTLDSDGISVDDKTLAYIPNIELVEDDPNRDIGLYPQTVQIGDRVWLDANGDGYQGPEEVGVPDVAVYLLLSDGVTRYGEQITDQDGFYLFDNLAPGSYSVQFDLATLPPEHVVTQPKFNGAVEADEGRESSANRENGQTPQIDFLAGGQQDLTADMGIYIPVAVGGIVWLDENGDGLQNEREPNITNVTVSLFNSQNRFIGQTRTQTNGRYRFEDLPPNEYYVVFDLDTLPPNHIPTFANIGQDDTRDSDAFESSSAALGQAAGQTDPTSLIMSGGELLTLDMGIVSLLERGGRVWLDRNVNGIQDSGESGVSNVRVKILHEDGTPVDFGNALTQIQTDIDGYYIFSDLRPGSYYVIFDLDTLPASHVVTVPDIDSNEQVDSDVNPSTGQTEVLRFASNVSSEQSVDMGIYPLTGVRVGGIVWEDINANGIQNVGEVGVSGVKAQLFDSADQLLGQTTTDNDGIYLFDGLKPSPYYVVFDLETLPANHHIMSSTSDIGLKEGRTRSTPFLADGMEELSLSMGLYEFSSIGDRVWEDRNANGLQEPDEPGMANININLLDGEGNHTDRTAVTGDDGRFEFTDIVPGRYQLEFLVADHLTITRQNAGSDDTIDSDVYSNSHRTAVTTLISGESDLTWDLGIYAAAAVGDRVWLDTDGNGIQNKGETGIAGIEIQLTDVNGALIASVMSDAQGFYLFEGLPPGTYQLQCALPNGYVYTHSSSQGFLENRYDNSDIDPIMRQSDVFVLKPGVRDLNKDIGLTYPASISSIVWVDGNGNGIRDEIESGIANMVVNLYNESAELARTTTTNIMGVYEFTDLTPSAYILEFIPPAGFTFTEQQEPNGSGLINSDVSPLTGRTQTVLLEPSEAETTLAAGIRGEDEDQGVTAIELISLKAITPEDGTVIIEWETIVEMETRGFHIYRGTTDDKNAAIQITEELIISQGKDGGRYIFEDILTLPNVIYTYWLREVETGGMINDSGVISVNTQLEQKGDSPLHVTFLP